ncbi:MAG: carboxymuconolactone decarboxylase family protein [Desulfobulbaceae bacterium]|nr:carboxymuconolactone decarboxylase family protein [Desulfobulbaceae bacterium]
MAQYPANYQWLTSQFGSVISAHQQLGKELVHAGPLDAKTCQLIKLAGAAATKAEGAVHSHIKRALKEGATPDEIYHTILLLTSTTGFPTAAAALSWARDIIEQE